MKYFILTFLLCLSNVFCFCQSLDYARDMYFFENKVLKIFKDFYYYYSPLAEASTTYYGKGLRVCLVSAHGHAKDFARSNIELDAIYKNYLEELMVIDVNQADELLLKSSFDVIICPEERIVSLKKLQPSSIWMVFCSISNVFKKPKRIDGVYEDHHFDYRLNGINKELLKIYRLKEVRFKYNAMMVGNKDGLFVFIRSSMFWFSFLGFLFLIWLGSYFRFSTKKNTYQRKLFLILTCLFGLVLFWCFNPIKLFNFYHDVNELRWSKSDDYLPKKEKHLSSSYWRLVYWRAMTEKAMIKNHMNGMSKQSEDIKAYFLNDIRDTDERVRMWCISFIEKSKNYFWLEDNDWNHFSVDDSFHVRSRYTRLLGSLGDDLSILKLQAMLQNETHPYVLVEIRHALMNLGVRNGAL